MGVSMDMEGRTVLVCGVARGGIGGAVARVLAQSGATLVLVDHARAIVDETCAEVERLGARAHGIAVDLTDADASGGIVADAVRLTGRLDGVANVAGGTRDEEWMPLEDVATEMFRGTLNLNLEYVFRICRDAAKAMIASGEGGSLVNVGSVSSLTSAPFHGPYGAAKSAIAALTRTMAFEWGKYGIRANTVHPGAVLSQRLIDRGAGHAAAQGGLAGSPGSGVVFTSVEEMANVVAFLLSDLSTGVSGQQIAVDSGMSTKFCAGQRVFEVKKFKPVEVPAAFV